MATYILVYFLGIMVGAIIAWNLHSKPIGDLRIDSSDPPNTYLFLELERELPDLKKRKKVCFRVKVEDYIPQK